MRLPAPRLQTAAVIAPLLLLLVAAGPSAPTAAPPQERTLSEGFDASDLEALHLDVGIGEFELVGGPGDRIEVRVRIECDPDRWGSGSCADRAERVRLASNRRDGRLELALEGTGSWRSRGMEVDIEVRAPSSLATTVDMAIGELTVEGMTGDLRIDLGIGEVSVTVPEASVRSVHLDVGTGEASLRGSGPGRRANAGLFVRELAWDEGGGRARLRVELGIGEIDVRLS